MNTSRRTYFEFVVAAIMDALHVTEKSNGAIAIASIRLGIFFALELTLFVMFLLIASFFVY